MIFPAKWRGGPAHSSLLRTRRRIGESIGLYRYSITGYWPFLQDHLPRKAGGTYLEAGAHDGWTGSNTYSLAAIWGWRGALVEPVPELYRQCLRNRSGPVFPCALVARDYPGAEITIETAGLLSTMVDSPLLEQSRQSARNHYGPYSARQISVPARTLDSLILECGFAQLDFLSLDIEGFEEPALRGLDFDRRPPRFILVEANYPEPVHQLLAPRYDLVAHLGDCDRFYALR
jgi:FkbM family methyltransferase